MGKQVGGIRVRVRPVAASTEASPELQWAMAVVPNQEATEARARKAAAILLASGHHRVWVCRSHHRLAGVTEFRYYTLTEPTVALLGGYIHGEVVAILESQPEEKTHGTTEQVPAKPRENPGEHPGGHSRGGRRIVVR